MKPAVVAKPDATPEKAAEKPAVAEKLATQSSLAPRPVVLPPRPVSTPEIIPPPVATPPAAPSPSPAELGLQSGGSAARASPPKRTTKPPPRRSEPPAPAHVIVPTDAVPQASKPTPAPAIQVMRIIAIGTKAAQPAPVLGEAEVESLEDDFDEVTPPAPRVQVSSEVDRLEASAAQVAAQAEADETELDDADLAPDSQEGRRTDPTARTATQALGEPVEELGRDDALSVPPEAPVFPPESSSAPQAAPPPPPRRTPSPPKRPDSARPSRKRALKKPWWEDLFGEDFTRAIPSLTERQIEREVDFIEESLGVAKGGVVLDLGCGSGSHAVELATRGYGVVGYDLSRVPARARCRRRARTRAEDQFPARRHARDGVRRNLRRHLLLEHDASATSRKTRTSRSPSACSGAQAGRHVPVDVANRDFAAQYSPSQLWYEGDSCVCMDDMSLDFITSRLRVKRSLIFDDGRSRECGYSIRLYSLHELGKLLHDVGFRVTEASGHIVTPGVFFGEVSPRLLVLAQRP